MYLIVKNPFAASVEGMPIMVLPEDVTDSDVIWNTEKNVIVCPSGGVDGTASVWLAMVAPELRTTVP